MDNRISYYKECPDIPDFGAYVGAPLVRVENDELEPPDINISYIYDKWNVSQKSIDDYIELVKKNGIEYDEYMEHDGFCSHLFSKGKCSIQFCTPGEGNECFLQVIYESFDAREHYSSVDLRPSKSTSTTPKKMSKPLLFIVVCIILLAIAVSIGKLFGAN